MGEHNLLRNYGKMVPKWWANCHDLLMGDDTLGDGGKPLFEAFLTASSKYLQGGGGATMEVGA